MDPLVRNVPDALRDAGETRGMMEILAEAHATRARYTAAGFRWLGRALTWPVRATVIRPFQAWRRRERVRHGLVGLGDNVLHDIGMTRDRLPYLIARQQDRDAA